MNSQDRIAIRVLDEAKYIIENPTTVRGLAQVFCVSKSTVHKDLTERLPQVYASLCESVEGILANNKAERHIRGGQATKMKYSDK